MSYWIPIFIGLLGLLVMLLPAIFLIWSAIIISRKIPRAPAKLLVAGTVLLAAASLDSLFNYFGAYFLDTQVIANMIVFTSLIFEGMKFMSLMLIGIALIKLSKVINTEKIPV